MGSGSEKLVQTRFLGTRLVEKDLGSLGDDLSSQERRAFALLKDPRTAIDLGAAISGVGVEAVGRDSLYGLASGLIHRIRNKLGDTSVMVVQQEEGGGLFQSRRAWIEQNFPRRDHCDKINA